MLDTTALRFATAYGILALVAIRFGWWLPAILLTGTTVACLWFAWAIPRAPVGDE